MEATSRRWRGAPEIWFPHRLMVKRLVKVPFVNIKVMFPREENRKDVTFKVRRGAAEGRVGGGRASLCGNQISDAPRHRRDVVPVTDLLDGV